MIEGRVATITTKDFLSLEKKHPQSLPIVHHHLAVIPRIEDIGVNYEDTEAI